MRALALAVAVLVSCSGSSSAPAPTHSRPPQPKAAAQPSKPSKPSKPGPKTFWTRMLAGESVWVLDKGLGDDAVRIEIELVNRRQMDGATLVDLTWTVVAADGKRTPFDDNQRIVTIAADDSGAILVTGDVDEHNDAEIVMTLRSGPTYTGEPSTDYTENADASFSVKVEGKAPDRYACFEEGPGSDAGDCQDVCFSEICWSESKGLMSMSGNYMGDEFRRAASK